MLELGSDFFGRKMECVGAGITGGEPPWAHEVGGAPCRGGRALDPRGQVLSPLLCSQCQIFSNIPEKIILNWHGIWRTFNFVIFFYCIDNSENRHNILFLIYLF